MSESDFTLISSTSTRELYPEYENIHSAPLADQDVQLHKALRARFQDLNITAIPTSNAPLLQFAAQGHASYELDTTTDSVLRWRGYVAPSHRGGNGQLGDATFFAKYHYRWGSEDFIVFTAGAAYSQVQYVLKEPGPGESPLSHCRLTDGLISAVVAAVTGDVNKFVYVYDRYWTRSRDLWDQVQKASWDKVILDSTMKAALQDVTATFFDSRDVYKRLGVPWKRGVIFYGPPGNGKTISIKALMHTLYERKDPIPSLYVKSAPSTYDIQQVFAQARRMTPCMLILEDIETIVTAATRSYFFNELDGLASNDGILIAASTNYLDRLDPGLAARPSRFDRKYLFPLPNEKERSLYCDYWRRKLQRNRSSIPFPEKLCPAVAAITYDFSFAYLQEAFVASLLSIARDSADADDDEALRDATGLVMHFHRREDAHRDDGGRDDDDDDLRGYKLWRVIKRQVATLRKDMGRGQQNAVSDNALLNLVDAIGRIQLPAANGPSDPQRGSNFAAFEDTTQGLPISSASGDDTQTLHAMTHQGGGGKRSYLGPQDLQRAGVGKSKYFAESAYEYKQ